MSRHCRTVRLIRAEAKILAELHPITVEQRALPLKRRYQ